MARQALGRGLEALIPHKEKEESVIEVELDKILTNPQQPRKTFLPEAMEDLVRSIEKHGIIQPVIVRQRGEQYELIAGERRLRAAGQAGMTTLPAIVKSASDEESLEMALIENIQRENLNPIEEARAYAKLINEFGLLQEDVAVQVGKNRTTVTNSLRLLKLPEQIQQWIENEKISTGHAKALLSLSAPPVQLKVAEEIINKGLSVREAEEKVIRIKERSLFNEKEKITYNDPFIEDIERKMKDYFSTKVRIKDMGKKGKVVIEYYSREEL